MTSHHILVMSDGTGETAYRMLKAAMAQFQEDVVITRYANIREREQIRTILRAAAATSSEDALVVYTFVGQDLRLFLRAIAEDSKIQAVDLLGPLMDALAAFFKKPPVAKPGLLHRVDEEYFSRIEAIEYAITHDDGRSIKDLGTADLVLVGVSRVSKTPVSIFLAQEGWKVANVTTVKGMKPPKELHDVDQHKIVGLTIDPGRLAEVRSVRLKQLGVDDSNYAEMEQVREEIQHAESIFRQNPLWPVIDVTGKSVEEISQEILDKVVGRGRKL
jgi:[pyruvate, water dikinase]-phosphate phosphotransferase / [pyruvate, water dikinase] kinase